VIAVCDARALELAIVNMDDNALKYADGTEAIDVEVAKVDGEACIRVVDRGPGIPAADRERIFDRFERGRGQNTSRVRGSGIGLALVRHIAEAHGGKAFVISPLPESDRGSAFEMVFPAERG
jgi:two-component system phosphate regulon sensor histidine kinase PhoR